MLRTLRRGQECKRHLRALGNQTLREPGWIVTLAFLRWLELSPHCLRGLPVKTLILKNFIVKKPPTII